MEETSKALSMRQVLLSLRQDVISGKKAGQLIPCALFQNWARVKPIDLLGCGKAPESPYVSQAVIEGTGGGGH